MAKRRTEVVAAGVLTAWTDSDTAMQAVGASLGVFGEGLLDPTVVLASETPLRNALFDVLLSLVEGGALEIRVTDGGRYAFRWRDDIAGAGLSSDGTTPIDLEPPSPYLAELQRARAERDDALGRADFAEALAAERERLLRLAGVRSPAEPGAASRVVSPGHRYAVPAIDTRDESVLDVLYALPPEPLPGAGSKPATTRSAPRKATAKKAAAKKPAREKTPWRQGRSKVTASTPTDDAELDRPPDNEVLVLTAGAAGATPDIDLTQEEKDPVGAADETEKRATAPRWSGYAIDRSRKQLVGFDRIVDEG